MEKTLYLLKAGSTIVIKYTGPRPARDNIEEDVSGEKNSG